MLFRMNLLNTQIETERLHLVPATVDFVEDSFREYREPVIQYMNWDRPEHLEEVKGRIIIHEQQMKAGKKLALVILSKESGEFLGRMALEDVQTKHPEMGGWLKESAQGYGYGREAAKALKEWAEAHLDYDYLLWPCALENKASCKLAELLGGTIGKRYVKTNARGKTFDFVDYWFLNEGNI